MKKILTILIFLLLFSCRGPNEPIPPRSNQFRPIYISGIYRTGEGGDYLGPMGNPQSPVNGSIIYDQEQDSSGGMLPSTFYSKVYPNPSNVQFVFEINVPQQAKCTISFVKGIGWAEKTEIELNTSIGTQGIATPYGLASLTLEKSFNPGVHRLFIDPSALSDGFYRIFVETDQCSYWHDILSLKDISCENFRRLGIAEYFLNCD